MPNYEIIKEKAVHEQLADVIERWHGNLNVVEARIGLEWAWPTDREKQKGDAPYLKLRGETCYATVRVTSLKQRLHGVPDAVITLDGVSYRGMEAEEQVATLDHEAERLVILKDKDGHFTSDDAGLPRLKNRIHDVSVGWFLACADRHGEHSLEVKQAKRLLEQYGWTLFRAGEDSAEPGTLPFGKPAAPTPDDVIRDAFAALLSVGYTDAQAQAAIDAALARGNYRAVADMIDAIYAQKPETATV